MRLRQTSSRANVTTVPEIPVDGEIACEAGEGKGELRVGIDAGGVYCPAASILRQIRADTDSQRSATAFIHYRFDCEAGAQSAAGIRWHYYSHLDRLEAALSDIEAGSREAHVVVATIHHQCVVGCHRTRIGHRDHGGRRSAGVKAEAGLCRTDACAARVTSDCKGSRVRAKTVRLHGDIVTAGSGRVFRD